MADFLENKRKNVSDEEKSFEMKGKYTELLLGKAEKDTIVLSPMSAKILK